MAIYDRGYSCRIYSYLEIGKCNFYQMPLLRVRKEHETLSCRCTPFIFSAVIDPISDIRPLYIPLHTISMAPRGVRSVIPLLKKPLSLFSCVRHKATRTSSETNTSKLTMMHNIHDRVSSGRFEQEPSVEEEWELPPRGMSLGDLNNIRWIQPLCAESFAC